MTLSASTNTSYTHDSRNDGHQSQNKFWQPSNSSGNYLSTPSFMESQDSHHGQQRLTLGLMAEGTKFGKAPPSQMNINAPSYVPNYSKNDNGEAAAAAAATAQELQKTRAELVVKNQIVKNLTDQLTTLNKRKKDSGHDTTIKIPEDHYKLFQDLTRTLQEKTSELDQTKARLEAMVVSLTVAPKFTREGGYDAQEMVHKLVTKLSLLQDENENLLKMVSFGNKSSLLVEIGLLRNENTRMKAKLDRNNIHKG